MERNHSSVRERPADNTKRPVVAFALASVRILLYSIRHGGKPLLVDYSTGEVRVDVGSAT